MPIESLREKVNWAADLPEAKRPDGKKGKVSQAEIGLQLFNMEPSTFNKYLGRGYLTGDQLTSLAECLGCSEYALAAFTFENFKKSPRGEALNWKDLVARGVAAGKLELDVNRGKMYAMGLRPRGVQPRPARAPRPAFKPSSLLRAVLPIEIGGVSIASWYVWVFGFDDDGVDNLLPRFIDHFGHSASERIPDEGGFVFPRKEESLEIPAESQGVHGLVILASKVAFPDHIAEGLAESDRPERLEPHLERLANWLGGRDPDTYRIVKLEFDVV